MCGEKWLETGDPFVGVDMGESQVEWLKAENERLTKQVQQLMSDTHRIDSARQSAVNQCRCLAEEVKRLNALINFGDAIGDRVRKKSGSEWQGRIVGWYSTELTPKGYAVESETHKGSVQIYPASALEKLESL